MCTNQATSLQGATLQPIESSLFKQLQFLLQREFQQNYRDTGALGGRFGVTIFLNLLFGLIFAVRLLLFVSVLLCVDGWLF